MALNKSIISASFALPLDRTRPWQVQLPAQIEPFDRFYWFLQARRTINTLVLNPAARQAELLFLRMDCLDDYHDDIAFIRDCQLTILRTQEYYGSAE